MNDRRYKKKLQQLDLAQRALALQEQFSPEQQARERLVQEQSRAAFYANEAFRREQQQLASLRQRQLLAETQLAEERARSFAPMQALTSSEQALRNAALAEDLQFAQKTTEQRLQEAAARVRAATANASSARTEADFARRTLESRVVSAMLLPRQTLNQTALQTAQLRDVEQQMRARQQQMDQEEGLFPARLLQGDVTALDAVTNFASQAGAPVTTKNAKGETVIVKGAADPKVFLTDPRLEVYREMLSRASGATAPANAQDALGPGVLTTAQTLANPQLRQGFLESVPRNRPYTLTPEPGTVDRGAEITQLLAAMNANPNLAWDESARAVQAIQLNPYAYGMHKFDPSLINPEIFARALEYIRTRQ